MKKFKTSMFLIAILSIAALAGCSGSSGGSSSSSSSPSGSALTVAEKASVVDSQSSTSKAQALRVGELYLSASDVPANSDYNNDRVNVYVHDASGQAFNAVNEILCMIAQTQYDDMINKGNYKAQVDKNKCSKNGDSASSAGAGSQNQSSGSTAPTYMQWIVNSSRADNSSPHIVKAWIHEDASGNEPAKIIYAKTTITEGVSSTNPYGIFRMDFKGVKADDGSLMFKGFMLTEKDSNGKVLLKFVDEGSGDGYTFSEAVTLDRAADGSTGSGSCSVTEGQNNSTTTTAFDIAFDTSNFLRQKGNDSKCFNRTSFDETAWRYGLYDSNGARVNINSGFPIKKDNYYGWIGYYGLWIPQEASVSNGDTVYKVAYGQGGETATPYTVVKVGGKLKKHTRKNTTLSNIKNIPLDWWECGQSGCTGYRVKWDATQGKFIKFAQQNSTTYMWENITEADLDLSTLQFGELNFWSQAIGGQVRVRLTCTGWSNGRPVCDAPANTTKVIYFVESAIFPGDSVPALRCYDNCPTYDSNTGVAGSGWSSNPDNATAYNYTFSSMVLKDSSDRSMLLTSASGTNQWGFMSGPLFNPDGTTTDLDGSTKTVSQALVCDWDNSKTCGWKAWSVLDVYYTWETGPNQWNQFTALQDGSGNALRFDPPMQVSYTHTQTDSSKYDYKYNGAKFFLEYSGFGNLWGIPGKCIDQTGADTSCGQNTRWIPEFTIADGSELINSSDNTIAYLVKALDKEQRMRINSGGCSGLTLTTYTLPAISDWVDPDIGAEPTVTNAPAVIGGVLQ